MKARKSTTNEKEGSVIKTGEKRLKYNSKKGRKQWASKRLDEKWLHFAAEIDFDFFPTQQIKQKVR